MKHDKEAENVTYTQKIKQSIKTIPEWGHM